MPFTYIIQMPATEILQVLSDACFYTAREVANDYRGYMLLRFSEPKSGRIHYAPGRGWYRASARNEYPAIKYGILYRSLQLGIRWRTPGRAAVVVGAARFPGTSYGQPNDPHYARELEGVEGAGPRRPYFLRAFRETASIRPRQASAHFISYLYGRATAFSEGRSLGSDYTLSEDMLVIPQIGVRSFRTLARDVKTGRFIKVIR